MAVFFYSEVVETIHLKKEKTMTKAKRKSYAEQVEASGSCPRYYVGLDVAQKKTQVCIIDDKGKIVREKYVNSRPQALEEVLRHYCASNIERIGIESGNYSGWLYQELKKRGFPIVCLDAFQIHRFLSVRRNKTDVNDARGIAELVRHGMDWVNAVHVKSAMCYEIRGLLAIRGRMVKQRTENILMLRGILKAYGGIIDGGSDNIESFRKRVIDAAIEIQVRDQIELRPRILPVLEMIERLDTSAKKIEEELIAMAESNPICKKFMEVPGIGPIVALSFFTAIENPHRFKKSSDVAAYFGLTPRIYQSGETETSGAISKMGNTMTRMHLVLAANVILSGSREWSSLKVWGNKLVKRVGYNKAKVAVARKLAMILFAMWRDDKVWYYNQEALQAAKAA